MESKVRAIFSNSQSDDEYQQHKEDRDKDGKGAKKAVSTLLNS